MKVKEILEVRVNSLGLSDLMKRSMWNEINNYARQKCKEQRELCYEYAFADEEWENILVDKDSIINAPEPKFD